MRRGEREGRWPDLLLWLGIGMGLLVGRKVGLYRREKDEEKLTVQVLHMYLQKLKQTLLGIIRKHQVGVVAAAI